MKGNDSNGNPRFKVYWVSMDLIESNEKNNYSANEIEELAAAIELAGEILQPLILKPEKENGKYILTTGERRWRAALLLHEKGRYPRFDNKVPCLFRNPEEISLPLSNESKELFSIVITNKQRNKTEQDQLMEYRIYKKIYKELKREKYKYIPEELSVLAGTVTIDVDGNVVPSKLTGVREREFIANQTGMSATHISKLQKINNKAGEELKEALDSGQVNIAAAELMVDLPAKDQKKIIEKSGKKKISTKEVRKYIDDKAEKTYMPVKDILEKVDALKKHVPVGGIKLSPMECAKFEKILKDFEDLIKS